MESETTQLAPAMVKLMALPAQTKCGGWLAKMPGSQTNWRLRISTVKRREASGAKMPVRMAKAARKKPMVVAHPQNVCEGGIQLGTNLKRPGMS
jgi:hypothetical protein